MLNGIFVFFVLASILLAAFTGRMEPLTRACVDSAGTAVEVALKLIGVMAFFLGLMRVASDAGLLRVISRVVDPVLRLLFPGLPRGHPASSAMVLNIGSNILGLGNAATPFGIKAMIELDRLNPAKGTATDAMVMFLAINTAGLTLLPSTVISVRASVGSNDPAGILATTWFASGCATVAGIAAAWLLARLPRYRSTAPPADPGAAPDEREDVELDGTTEGAGTRRRWGRIVAWLFLLAFGAALAVHVVRSTVAVSTLLRELTSYWILPVLIAAVVLFGWCRGVKVYASLVEGAKEGFQVAVRIIPYLVAIMVMVGMFRASGGLDLLVGGLDRVTRLVGLPAEALPMALLRPLSGSGALAIMTDIMTRHGPDSFIGYLVSTIQGSTETTFYVLAVYFGSVGIKRTRHALPACLLADAAGIAAAVFVANLAFA